jgi:uncharacterized protein YjbI with pentapeptide repeats
MKNATTQIFIFGHFSKKNYLVTLSASCARVKLRFIVDFKNSEFKNVDFQYAELKNVKCKNVDFQYAELRKSSEKTSTFKYICRT